MRICVIGSCGKKKASTSTMAPTCQDLMSKDALIEWKAKFPDKLVPARDMYLGAQSRELGHGVDILRSIEGVSVDYYIISAGFGVLNELDLVPPYECTFSGLSKAAIIKRARQIEIFSDFENIIQNNHDFLYLALGKNYLVSLGENWWTHLDDTVVLQFGRSIEDENITTFSADNEIVRRFSTNGYKIHGAAGFKGDLLRILATHATESNDPYSELMGWTDTSYLLQLLEDMSRITQTRLI